MPTHTAIVAENAPAAIGPYSTAIEVGPFVFASGQLPVDPASGGIVPGCVACQTRQVFANISAVMEAAGLALSHIVKATVFLVDMADFAKMNEVYAEQFAEPFPARSTVAVAELPKGARVEIEVVAVRA